MIIYNFKKLFLLNQNIMSIQNDDDENEDSFQYSVDPQYINLINKTLYYYVLKPDYRFLPDTEKSLKTIKISKKSFEKIFSISDINFLEILSYIEIVITKIRYEYFHSLLLQRSKFDPKLKRLLKTIESYSMNGKTPISDYSIKKILFMAGLNEQDLPNFMNIKKLANLTFMESKLREKKIRRLSSKANRMKLNDFIKDWENLKYKKIEKEDKSKKIEQQNLFDIDSQFQGIVNVYNMNKNEIEKRKNEFLRQMENQKNIFVSIEDNEGNIDYIRKDYIILIKGYNNTVNKKNKKNLKVTFKDNLVTNINYNTNNNNNNNNYNNINYTINDNTSESSTNNEDNCYEIENCNNEIILIPKEKIENYIYDEKELFYKIQSNNDLPTLTSKIKLIEAFDNWKYINQIMNIPSKYPKNRWRKVQLKKMTFQKQNEINHLPLKEEIEKNKINQKNNLLNNINTNYNLLLEVNDNQLVNYNIINHIINDSSGYDNFQVREFLSKKNIEVSKKEIDQIYNDEDKYYIKIIDKSNGKSNIINKNDLIEKLENNSNMREPIFLTNYNNKNISIKPKDILIEKMNENELPYQHQKGEEINRKLKNDLKNTIIFKQIGNFLIPEKILNDIQKDKSEINEFEVPAIENYNDNFYNPSLKIKINKKDIEKIEQLPEYIEIIYDIYNEDDEIEEKNNLISKNDLLKSIDDNFSDEIILTDFIGNTINTRKSEIQISNNKNKEKNYNMERSSKDYADDLLKKANGNKTYQLIKDENKIINLCDKSYINLIFQHEPKNPFDKYEIPNINNEIIKVSKSKIENIKNPKNYIYLIDKNTLEKNLFLIDDLQNEHEELSNENYLFSIYGKEKKVPIKVKDLNIVNDPKKIIFLPPQPEEAIAYMRYQFNDPKKDINIIQVVDIHDNPILVFKSEIEDKKEDYYNNKNNLNSKGNFISNVNNINNKNNIDLNNTNNNNIQKEEFLKIKDIHGFKKEIKISLKIFMDLKKK